MQVGGRSTNNALGISREYTSIAVDNVRECRVDHFEDARA